MNSLSTKAKVSLTITVFLLGAALGRYTVPEKVRVETKVVTAETKTSDQDKKLQADKNEHKTVVRRELIHADGSKEIVTQTTDDTKSDQKAETDTKTTDSSTKSVAQTQEVTKGAAKVTISALVGPSLSFSSGFGPLVFGGHISKPILGPITVGLWGMSNSTGGLSLGLTF